MSTLRDDSAAAQPERSAVGSAFRWKAATLSPKSSPPVRGESVVAAKTRRAAALAQRRRPTSEN